MVRIKRVSIGSAVKVAAIVYALGWAVFGLFFVGFEGLIFSTLGASLSRVGNQFPSQSSSAAASSFGAFSIVTLCIIYVVGIVFALIGGAIVGAIYAFIYNLAAGWVGGLEVELTRIQAPAANNLPPM